ncbi:Rhodanese domain protein [Thioalkalivibrio nitratireducens DSM 14787]|uniref:TVP38/TMEM64 family membrane protein n=1 Tax=Thioalkalivibrio nitratireducens (strain DSM 14787 / UNIQEM 213 / ALEN2) TaxID=1255043 RepID=L0DZT3_THIND|nr:TVP38/TMEM64 family protein [Thioalkalivibrio nitratireducens]AGA34563.1 Rhodanese domain protein [Thioalkalivibrio nitratireducens DSM 14787]
MSPWLWGPALLLVAAAVIYLIGWIPIESIDFVTLEARFQAIGPWSGLLFVLAFVALAMLPLPTTVWVLLGGSLYGPAVGTVLSVGSATIAAVLAFVTGRYLARDYVRARAGPRTCRVIRGVEAEGWRFVAMTRLIPVFPFAPTNYALGLTGIRLRTYTVTTAIALVPNLAAYTWLGHATRQAISGAENLIQILLLALALVAMLLFLPGFIRRLASNSAEPC